MVMEKKEIQVVDFENLPVDFDVADAVLAKIKEEYGTVPDCSTKEGYAKAKAGIAVCRPLRVKIEAKRKKNNAGYKKRNDDEAARITSFLVAIEDPLKEARQVQDAIKEKEREVKAEKEKERVAAIEKDINTIRNVVLDCHGKTSLELSGIIESLDETEIEVDRFAEHTPIAEAAKIEAIQKLEEMRDQALANEKADEERKAEDVRLAKEREEFEAEQAEAREKEKAAAIQSAKDAQDLADKEAAIEKEAKRKDDIKAKIQAIKDSGAYDPEATAEQIEGRITLLEAQEPSKDTFEEYTEEACLAIETTWTALRAFHDMKVEQEKVAAAKAEEEAAENVVEEAIEDTASDSADKVIEAAQDGDIVDAEFVEEELSDTQLLDFLEYHNGKARYTGKCIFRLSETGRGWRLHETSREGAYESVREALVAAVRNMGGAYVPNK